MVGWMVLYALITAITIGLAYLVRQPQHAGNRAAVGYYGSKQQLKNHVLCIGIFAILFFFSAIRYGIGNDYFQYVKTFHEISVGGYVVTETGFNLLVRGIYFLCGGEVYQLVFAIFAFSTLLLFLYTFWKQSVDFRYTFFLFMTLGLYFQTYNTVRYYFALAVVLYTMRFIFERKPVSFVLIIVATSLIHKSVLIVIPLFYLARFHWKKWQMGCGILLGTVCLLFHSQVLQLALCLYPSYRDTIYLEGGTSIVSILRCLLVLMITVVYYRTYVMKDEKLLFYAKLNMLAILVYVFFSFLPVITRIGYYLTISHVMFVPALLRQIQERREGKLIRCLVTVFGIGYFLIFLYKASAPGVQLLPYQSWLFTEDIVGSM